MQVLPYVLQRLGHYSHLPIDLCDSFAIDLRFVPSLPVRHLTFSHYQSVYIYLIHI